MQRRLNLVWVFSLLVRTACCGAAEPSVPMYGVHEVVFQGPVCHADDSPARDVDLVATWRHESGRPTYKVHGFWDGDGLGGTTGNVFKVRFCPTETGRWTLVSAVSNASELNGQHVGYSIHCVASTYPGFWLVDREHGDGHWYRRSDGSHPYIVGNTMYTFLSQYDTNGPTGSHVADDIRGDAQYFKKVRFSIMGDRYPDPKVKPFLDEAGRPTDDGDFSYRPNPAWFRDRLDVAVRTAYEQDLIADLILCGPDTEDARSVLRAGHNHGDAGPLLRYVAARYGSYPNVWMCLCNEFDIKTPSYSTDQIDRFGRMLREFLPYPTPLSIHARPRNWHAELNTTPPWHDHVIIQKKIKKLPVAADWVWRNHAIGGGVPVIDDELAYEGAGDGWSEADVIEAHLGAFLGGGYGTTGQKPVGKRGQYFLGHFNADEHKAADNLQWFRQVIDEDITFWQMTPVVRREDSAGRIGIFQGLDPGFRVMAWPGREYVLGTNRGTAGIRVGLPPGRWRITRYDLIAKDKTVIATEAAGTFVFDAPPRRAILFHFQKQ